MNSSTKILLYLFSFFLAFGKYDPFATNGLYFDLLIILLIISIVFSKKILLRYNTRKNEIFILSSIGLMLFIIGALYGHTLNQEYIFNFKYFAAIILFILFSLVFESEQKLMYRSILVFSISCALLTILYYLGLFDSAAEIRNNRLIIFEENPNSISSRMAIGFIILFYFVINNPLELKFLRFFFLLFLPFLFLFIIETGSRGSFIALGLGTLLIVFFSKINLRIKTVLFIIITLVSLSLIDYLSTSSLFERFSNSDMVGGRGEIWSDAIEIFYDYPMGVGENGYKVEMLKRYGITSDTHNIFIYMLVTGGFIVFFLFMYFLKELFLKSLNKMKEGDSLLFILFVFLLFLMSKTGGVLTYLIMWYFFAVINSSKPIRLDSYEK